MPVVHIRHCTAALATCLVLVGSATAGQEHSNHQIPSVPHALLTRSVPVRSGLLPAHDETSTRVKRAQELYDQGLSYLHSYVWIEAARSFNQALQLDQDLALAHVGLSYAYTELNKPDAALDALARAQALASKVSTHDRLHIDARALQMAAEAAPQDTGKLLSYRRALDSALVQQPADAELRLLRGIAESPDPSDRGQGSTAASVGHYEQALALGGVAAHHYLSHALENTDRIAAAVEHAGAFARLASAIPHAQHMHGHVLRRSGNIEEAIAAFERADRLHAEYFAQEKVAPEHDWHHEHNLDLLGSSYRYIGQLSKAERSLARAFQLPSSLAVQMYNKRAWPEFLIARGRHEEAVAAAKTLQAHPVSLVRAVGHIEAGHAMLAVGRFPDAAGQANLAVRELRAASNGQALVAPALERLQGEFFLRTGERAKGRAMLEKLVRKVRALPGPDNWVQALFTMEAVARTARDAGDWEFARWAAQQMIDHDGAYAGSHYAMGLVLAQSGDAAGTRRAFATAARLWRQADPSLPELVKILSAR
jgi:tetratricopeptide (TPR) repeat protein